MTDKLKQIKELLAKHDVANLIVGQKAFMCGHPTSYGMTLAKESRAALLSAIAELEAKWVPVSEGLPEALAPVLATIKKGEKTAVIEADWTGSFGWYFDVHEAIDKGVEHGTVIAWQPMPEPYRGNE
jgi:hypothetical protein